MINLLQRLSDMLGLALPSYAMAAAIVLLFYAIQAEIRFGKKARTHVAEKTDRGSSYVVSLSANVSIVGFVLAMKAQSTGSLFGIPLRFPAWLLWPGAHDAAVGWTGVGLGVLGILLRLWAVLTLRERYTRTLLVHDNHAIERGGPYRIVRHPGYTGSLLCLNGIALASCSAVVFVLSLAATFAAYAYRVRMEDAMLVDSFGEQYRSYSREVGALIPFVPVSR
jgi:protein-S-isoprenylcysteine O-methyltransferase Ste14